MQNDLDPKGLDYTTISRIVFECRERQKVTGEGDQMLSRWISEALSGHLSEGEAFGTAWQTSYTGDEWHFAREASFSPSDLERGIVKNVTPLYATPQPAPVVTDAARDVLAERKRQVEAEGWTPEHDDQHDRGEMATAAGCYALSNKLPIGEVDGPGSYAVPKYWPWDPEWWKPTNRRRELVKAGALILAEIERLDRAALQTEQESGE